MKKIFFTLLLFLNFLNAFSQEKIISEEDVINAYPFQVNYFSITIQNENLKMAFMDVIPGNYNNQNILLLHGKNFNGAYWEETIKHLTSRGYRVIVPDQIGFGKSSIPDHIQYSFFLLAKNTKSLLDSLGIKSVAVIGHSMGGMLATRMALMYPDFISKVILECPIGLKNYDRNQTYLTVDEQYKKEIQQDYSKLKKYHQETYYHNQWKSEYGRWVKMLAIRFTGDQREKFAMNSAKLYDMINTQPVIYEFSEIKIPVLFLAGELDPMLPPVDSLVNYINSRGKRKSYFQFQKLDKIGHIPHIEDFNMFTQKIDGFLKD